MMRLKQHGVTVVLTFYISVTLHSWREFHRLVCRNQTLHAV